MGNVKIKYKLGVILAGISAVCGIVVYSAPDFADLVLGYLTHSTFQYTINPFNAVNFIAGIVLWFIIGVIIEFVYSRLSELEEKK